MSSPTPRLLHRLARLSETVTQDFRYAARALRLRPGFTLTVVVTLALGIGANAVMFGILDRLLLRAPEHIVAPERVVQIHTSWVGSDAVQTTQPYALYKDLLAQVPHFQSIAVYTPTSLGRNYYPLGRVVGASRVAGAQVTPSFFTILGVRPEVGRFFQEDEAGESNPQKLAVIGYGFWQRHFGGRRDAIGAPLDIGADRYTVVGVAPKGFTGVELSDIDVWLPIASADGLRFVKGPEWRTTRSSQWLNIIARLAPGATPERSLAQATAAYRAFARARNVDSERGGGGPSTVSSSSDNPDSMTVILGSVIPGRSPSTFGLSAKSGVVQVSRLLGGVSLLVLLLACANVANLMLVRALHRRREIAVRLALGISRQRLIAQVFLEALLLATLGSIGAIAIAFFGSGLVRTLLIPDAAWTGSALDLRVLGATAAAALLAAILTSLLPVVQATNPELSGELKSGAREGVVSRSYTRATLMATQTALALVLLAGAALFLRSLQRAMHSPYGIDLDRVVVASIEHRTVGLSNAEARQLYLRFAERARTVPGISASAVSIAHSFGLGWGTSVHSRGQRLRLEQGFSQYAITPDYFRVMGIRLVEGRVFGDADREGSPLVAIVNETAARAFWPRGEVIGQCVQVGSDTMPCTTIVGVVTNAQRQQLVEGPIPQIYRPLLQLAPAITDNVVSLFGFTLLARADHPDNVVESLHRSIQSVAPNVPYAHVRTLRSQFGRHTRSWTLGASMFSVFGALALLLAAIGLYSVVVFTLAQRRHEYGVRVALGATGGHLVWITILRGLLPATAGLVVGLALALAGGKVVGSMLFQTPPNDPLLLGSVSALLLGAAGLACLLPGLRAARTDPMVALRAE